MTDTQQTVLRLSMRAGKTETIDLNLAHFQAQVTHKLMQTEALRAELN